MTSRYERSIRQNCLPLEPIPTDVQPRLTKLIGIRVVLFDIYGTLLISSSGDLFANRSEQAANAFTSAVAEVGLSVACDGAVGLSHLQRQIDLEHQRAHREGIEYPEVDIERVWSQLLWQLHESGLVDAAWQRIDIAQLAVEYELRANPVWPMPHARDCLVRLDQSGLRLGLISNAQFMTLDILDSLLAKNREPGFAWDADLQFFSYQHGRAKPGMELFRLAVKRLYGQGIQPSEVVYVGNDMRNDIWPGGQAGFRTALFAGDQRSLRWRDNDARVAEVKPDLIVTDLADLTACVR